MRLAAPLIFALLVWALVVYGRPEVRKREKRSFFGFSHRGLGDVSLGLGINLPFVTMPGNTTDGSPKVQFNLRGIIIAAGIAAAAAIMNHVPTPLPAQNYVGNIWNVTIPV